MVCQETNVGEVLVNELVPVTAIWIDTYKIDGCYAWMLCAKTKLCRCIPVMSYVSASRTTANVAFRRYSTNLPLLEPRL